VEWECYVAVLCTYEKKKTGRRYKVSAAGRFALVDLAVVGWIQHYYMDYGCARGVLIQKIVKTFVSSSNFSEMKSNGIIH
jgi:hypothetical protein